MGKNSSPALIPDDIGKNTRTKNKLQKSQEQAKNIRQENKDRQNDTKIRKSIKLMGVLNPKNPNDKCYKHQLSCEDPE